MTANPACAAPETSLREISQLMVEHDCGCVPIVENMMNKKPVGTVTDRDITIRAFATGQNPADLRASDVMTTGVETITPDASIEKCADVMEDKKIRRVVVVDNDGKLVGMVAQADIAEYGPNPNLIGNVVNEISDAPASPTHRTPGGFRDKNSFARRNFAAPPRRLPAARFKDYDEHPYRSKRSRVKEESSVFGASSLLPLLAGIGAAFAAKYYFGASEKIHRQSFNSSLNKHSYEELPHSTNDFKDTNLTGSSNTSTSTSSGDLSRTATASPGAASTSSSFDTNAGSSGRSDFGNQASGGSADLDTFGSGDFSSASGDDLKPILEVGRNPGKI